jgi:hypothetical protein
MDKCEHPKDYSRELLGGSEKWKGSPNMRVAKEDAQFTKDKKTKNLRKSVLASKVVNLFTHAHAPPFIG